MTLVLLGGQVVTIWYTMTDKFVKRMKNLGIILLVTLGLLVIGVLGFLYYTRSNKEWTAERKERGITKCIEGIQKTGQLDSALSRKICECVVDKSSQKFSVEEFSSQKDIFNDSTGIKIVEECIDSIILK